MIPKVVGSILPSNTNLVSGDVGIEIEVEGTNLPHPKKYWECTTDSSLRGNSMEYVLTDPMKRSDYKKSLAYFSRISTISRSDIKSSVRCSIHVHVNVQDLTLIELLNFVCLYLVFEGAMSSWCGPGRDGNLFCLKSSEADYMTYLLIKAIQSNNFSILNTPDIRYGSMNLTSIFKYGSLEFRSMGTPKKVHISRKTSDWVECLLDLKERSRMFSDPKELMLALRLSEDPLQFVSPKFKSVFGSVKGLKNKVDAGILNSSDVCFCSDWIALKTPVPFNPFAKAF